MEDIKVKKIAIIGAESTGKTQLCQELATHYKTLWVPEYAREYFNQSDIYKYTLHDLELIAKVQTEWEQNAVTDANTFLFCDTALQTLKIWAELEFGSCPSTIRELIIGNPYDFFLITGNDVEWVADAQRLNKFSRDLIFEMNLREAISSGKKYAVITGRGPERSLNARTKLSEIYSS